MKKPDNKSTDKELLQKVESLIDGDDRQKHSNSFLGFCSRLLSVKPKKNDHFQDFLKQKLLEKHPFHVHKNKQDFSAQISQNFYEFSNFLTNFIMKNIKKIVLASIPVLALSLFFAFSFNFNSQKQLAHAMEIMNNDPKIQQVIDKYNLNVKDIKKDVKIENNKAYISLDSQVDVNGSIYEVAFVVDLDSEKIQDETITIQISGENKNNSEKNVFIETENGEVKIKESQEGEPITMKFLSDESQKDVFVDVENNSMQKEISE